MLYVYRSRIISVLELLTLPEIFTAHCSLVSGLRKKIEVYFIVIILHYITVCGCKECF